MIKKKNFLISTKTYVVGTIYVVGTYGSVSINIFILETILYQDLCMPYNVYLLFSNIPKMAYCIAEP